MKKTTIADIASNMTNVTFNEREEIQLYFSYARASDKEQGLQGMTVEAQRQEHIEWAKKKGIEITEYFVDNGYSAKDLKRKDIQRMLHIISENKPRNGKYTYKIYVIIRYQSRLIRNMMYKRSLQNVFDKFNVEVICMEGTFQSDDEGQQFGADVQTLLDESEIRRISPRVIASYRQSAKMGNYPLGGHILLGYKRVKNESYGKGTIAVLDPETAPEVYKIFQVIHEKRPTVEQMVRFLNKNHVLNTRWTAPKLVRLIDNHLYYGRLKTKWFDSEDEWDEEVRKNWYSMDHHTQPLISKEMWEETYKIVHHINKECRHLHYFKNMVRCQCGQWMIADCAYGGHKTKTLYKYMTCKNCKKRINENIILRDFLERYKEMNVGVDKERIIKVENKLERVDKRLGLINNLFDENEISEDEWKEERRNIKIEKKRLETEREALYMGRKNDFLSLSYPQRISLIRSYLDHVLISFDSDAKIHFEFKEKKTKQRAHL